MPNRTSRLALLAIPTLCLILANTSAKAQVVVYSDTTTFSGFGYAPGGSALSGNDTISNMAADDIDFTAGHANYSVNSISFSVANFNTTAVSARPLVRFYDANGTGGGPGTLLGGLNFSQISFAAGSVQLFTYSAANILTIPSDDAIWAGIAFDNNSGATGATATQLNSLGQGLFAPPTVGSSQDVFFQSTTPSTFLTSNPAGSFFFFGGSPVADFGWSFSVAPAVTPEPTGLAYFACFGLTGLAVAGRNRLKLRKSA